MSYFSLCLLEFQLYISVNRDNVEHFAKSYKWDRAQLPIKSNLHKKSMANLSVLRVLTETFIVYKSLKLQ